MSRRRTRWLALVLCSSLLCVQAAYAQKVVVLELDGDRKNRLRAQIERALIASKVVELVSIKKYKEAAKKKKVKPAQMMTPAGVAKVARTLGLDAAVEGAVADTFFVRILDPSGRELWKKDLPLKGRILSPSHAFKLAKAIAAAAKSGSTVSEVAEDPPETEAKPEPEPEREKEREVEAKPEPEPERRSTRTAEVERESPKVEEKKTGEGNGLPQIDLSGESSGISEEERERRRREEMAEAHTSTDGEPSEPDPEEIDHTTQVRVAPKMMTIGLSGTTTWRAYCSRPGVATCREFDALEKTLQPKGDTVDFSPQVPYAGFAASVDFFPLARLNNPLMGLGVVGSYSRGFSLTNVKVETTAGGLPEKQVISVEEGLGGALTFRYFFSFGAARDRLMGYVGLRGGVQVRSFEVDPDAQVPLPGSHRTFPTLGLDLSFPLARLVRVEASGSYFLSPNAGPDEIAGYGNALHPSGGVESRGFNLEAGLAGDLWGPLGYSVRFKLTRFTDQFKALPGAPGQKWPCVEESYCGGAAEETYSGLYWGVTLGF